MYEHESRWTKEHIDKTFEIINKTKKSKPLHIRVLDKSIYWILLFISLLGNFVISILMVILLFVLRPIQFYPVIATLGIGFGLLIERLIRDMEHLERKHHIIFLIIIPLTAMINFFIITNIVDSFKVANKFNPLIVGIAYTVSFILPYIYYQFLKNEGR